MNIRFIVRGLFNYLVSVALAVVFALFLSARIGWFLVAAFLLAPLISLGLSLVFVNNIYVSCQFDTRGLCKGESCDVGITVTNGSFFPSPPIKCDMIDNPGIRCSERYYTVSLNPFASESFYVPYNARICGPWQAGIDKISVSDYFGIFTFAPKKIVVDDIRCDIAVIPDIAEISPDDPVVAQIMQLSAQADDSEDTTDNTSLTFGGFPGYDNREYIPGDPLKRINWKLSAKRGRLLVRLDDEAMCSSLSVVLDSVFDSSKIFPPAMRTSEKFSEYADDEIIPAVEQMAIENALGILRVFIKKKYSLNFMLMGSDGWDVYPVADENDLAVLRTELSRYKFSKDKDVQRFPEDEIASQKGSVSIFCTPCLDMQLYSLIGGSAENMSKGSIKTAIYSVAADPQLYRNGGGIGV